ncbi:hypothetical protein MALGJ_00550 [Mycolicibacter algericus]|uniref:Terminase n=1 Tax=Mycolicibacter algericus TaxID=1288388 RepID=A0A7I9Y3Y6_MYCAL|nr:hypothetical protein MALGJ_00550 [Mycolicibacter algericus]
MAATVGGVGMSLPRQVGKTYLLAGMVFGLCVDNPGLLFIWSAHHARTHGETFLAMQAFASKTKVAPFIEQVFKGSGDEEIRFVNGSRILFGARERGFGRGIPGVDGLIADEAQILSDKAQENMLATMNTSSFGLHVYVGTPPKPEDASEAFTRMRTEALSGTSDDLAWIECGADPDADPDDRSQYPVMNPSHPHRTPLVSILRLRKKLTLAGFLREAMGIWPVTGGGLIGDTEWSELADPGSSPVDPVSFGVYVNKTQTHAAIAVAGYREDGLIHLGIVPAESGSDATSLPGMGWIVDRVSELVSKWSPCAVVIDERSSAGALIEDLRAVKVDVATTNSAAMANACGKFYSAVKEKQLRHLGSMALQTSVCSGKQRDLADAWAWDRKDRNSDITQLVAVTLALHGLMAFGRPETVEVWEPLWT